MKIIFLGTGTSQGVPVIACDCLVCTSTNAKDKRLRVSVLVEVDGKHLVIDSGPDFRYQMLRAEVKHLDAILITHEHKDHIAGLDDVRAFNFKQQQDMEVYAQQRVLDSLKREFHYAFSDFKYPGIPLINLHEIDELPFSVAGIQVNPIQIMHYRLPILGYRIGDFTYITDAKIVAEQEKEKIKGSRILVINALQRETHISHFTLDEAIAFAEEIGAEQTFFTHISHRMGRHDDINRELPNGIKLAYDGLMLEL